MVVGGGVVGAATAWYSSRAGIQPLLLEARPALCTLTTPVASGAFRLQFDNREELELVRESVDLFLNFLEATGQRAHDIKVRRQGYLWLTTEEAVAARQRDLVSRQRDWGLDDVELLDGDEVRRRFPYVGENVVQARFRASDGFLDTKELTLGLARASRAEVVVDCAVVGFRIESGRLTAVETTRGAVETEAAVICGGPLSGLIARGAGIDLPVKTVRRQKLVLPEVPEVPPEAPMTIDEDTLVHWRPALRGAWLLFTDPSTRASPPAEVVHPDPAFAYSLLDPRSPTAAARVTPFWRSVWERGTAHWWIEAGQYTMTPDHRPLIGETEVGGLWVNTGYSGHGIMASPAGSRILVDLVTGKGAAGDNPFPPDRDFERPDVATL
ncbi:MAG: NAD(P)/FAD-dependent oxidoreductase [Actinomycetota bacterium]